MKNGKLFEGIVLCWVLVLDAPQTKIKCNLNSGPCRFYCPICVCVRVLCAQVIDVDRRIDDAIQAN